MMLDINVAQMREGLTRYAPLGALVAGIMIVQIVYVVWVRRLGLQDDMAFPPADPLRGTQGSNTEALGAILYTDYVLPFQLAAVVLLVAIVAAIVLTMRSRPGLKQQDIGRQVATRKEDRVRLVKVDSEPRQ
jgi:NADH-quinone oxidoreductase subunit J